jgi:hypothetical protein
MLSLDIIFEFGFIIATIGTHFHLRLMFLGGGGSYAMKVVTVLNT